MKEQFSRSYLVPPTPTPTEKSPPQLMSRFPPPSFSPSSPSCSHFPSSSPSSQIILRRRNSLADPPLSPQRCSHDERRQNPHACPSLFFSTLLQHLTLETSCSVESISSLSHREALYHSLTPLRNASKSPNRRPTRRVSRSGNPARLTEGIRIF